MKANIFLPIADDVAHFLNQYHTDMPFLAQEMFDLVFHMLERFVKEDVLEKVTSTVKLVQQNLTNSSVHKDTSAVDIGFVANKRLHDPNHKKDF